MSLTEFSVPLLPKPQNSGHHFFRFHYNTQVVFLKTVVFENNLTTVKFRLDETKRQYNYLS